MTLSDPGALPPGEVHVWHGTVPDDPAGVIRDTDLAVLDPAQRERSARFARPADRSRFVAVHAAERRLLGGYLGTDPAAIRLGRAPCCRCGSGDHGRPRVEWPVTALSHNLSHSGQDWMLAVTQGRQVGVDIEAHRQVDVARMASACLTGSESTYLANRPEAERLAVFFRCWTRKEAVLKACGVGLAGAMSGVEVQPQRSEAVTVPYQSGACPRSWLVQDLPARVGYSAALAQPAEDAGAVVLRVLPGP